MYLPKWLVSAASFALLSVTTTSSHAVSSDVWNFDFGTGPVQSGFTQVFPTTAYDSMIGYGFGNTSGLIATSRLAPDNLRSDFITSASPFKFSANVSNGNYDVIVTTGDNNGTSDTSIKSEFERIIAQKITTKAGQFSQYRFTVHIKDGVLDLSFYGVAPKVNAIEIQKAPTAITLFLAGDSTVTDQNSTVFAGWGQELSSYLRAGVAVGNYADSGESSWSFWNGFYVPGIQPKIKAGDFLLIQFGHNDEKGGTTTQYQTALKRYIDDARAHGATPVLITPLERDVWSGGKLTHSHGAFPAAMQQLAIETQTPCIDLTTKSYDLYVSMGQSASTTLFVSGDKTHTNPTGALKIAGLVRDGIRELDILPLANFITEGTPPDPLPTGGIYEAEQAVLGGSGTVASIDSGFNGTGYVDLSAGESTLTFNNVDGNGGGAKTLGIRYSLGSAGGSANLIINGKITAINFPTTGSFTKWSTLGVDITLNNNKMNTIQIATTGADSGNIDYINIPPSSLAADVYQAEDALLAGGTFAESINSGFNGAGYANSSADGGTITFNNVNPNGGGAKLMTIRYALGGTGIRSGSLIVNGVTRPIVFQTTGSWTTWVTRTVNITLSATSTNTIQFATTGTDFANIDQITIPW